VTSVDIVSLTAGCYRIYPPSPFICVTHLQCWSSVYNGWWTYQSCALICCIQLIPMLLTQLAMATAAVIPLNTDRCCVKLVTEILYKLLVKFIKVAF